VPALTVIARCPFEANVWARIVVEVRFRGIEEGDGAADAIVFEVQGGVFERFAGGVEG
jgi:hypothetical protein